MRENTLKTKWANDQTTLGLWLSGTDPLTARKLAGSGADYVCIDMQHGTADYAQVLAMLMAMEGQPAIPLVRVPWNEPGIIGRVLDAGAMGVIIPMVNTVEQAEAAVASCHYPPLGSRSNGPIVAADALGPDYATEAGEQIICIPMIETVEGVSNVGQIAAVPGVAAFYVGPADLSRSLGIPPSLEQADDVFLEAAQKIVAAAQANRVTPGIHSTPAMSTERIEFGFQMVTVTSDVQGAELYASNSIAAVRAGKAGQSVTGY